MTSETTRRRVVRFGCSAALRTASAAVQLWGGLAGRETALIIEAGEEFTDSLMFGAVGIEASTNQRGLTRRARRLAVVFAVGAATMASVGTAAEIVHDGAEWLAPLGGFNLASHEIMAASIAVGLSALVFMLNFSARKSGKVSDKFAYRDALRDFVIPGSILILAAIRAPHIGEYLFETAGLAYGWYNVTQLLKGWGWRLGRKRLA